MSKHVDEIFPTVLGTLPRASHLVLLSDVQVAAKMMKANGDGGAELSPPHLEDFFKVIYQLFVTEEDMRGRKGKMLLK